MLFGTVIHASWLLRIFPCVTNEEGTMGWILWVETIPSIVRWASLCHAEVPGEWSPGLPHSTHNLCASCLAPS